MLTEVVVQLNQTKGQTSGLILTCASTSVIPSLLIVTIKSSGLPGVVYDFSCSTPGPVKPMVTARRPESPEQGLGRNPGKVGDVGTVQVLLETSPEAVPGSSTVASTWDAVRMSIIIILIICLFMLTPNKLKKKKGCQVSLAVNAFTRCMDFFGHGILMELNGLLGLEGSCEHLVGLDILVEYLVPLGIGAPGTIEGVLGLKADEMRWNIDAIVWPS